MATLNVKGLDDGLYEKLKARARQQHRSVAQEVTHILEETLAAGAPTSLLDLERLGARAWVGKDAAAHVALERDSCD